MPRTNAIQFRRGSSGAWTSGNPTLGSGEPGFETDSFKIKIGDGTTAWTGLNYIGLYGTGISGYCPRYSSTQIFANSLIYDNGTNIGIGTTSPSGQLHVIGSGIFASGLNISNQTANTIASFDSNKNLISLSTGTYPSLTELSYVRGVNSAIQTQLNNKQSTLTNPVTGTGVANHIAYWNSSSGIVADSGQLYWDSTNNRLGIGTISPSVELDVKGTNAAINCNYLISNIIMSANDWNSGVNGNVTIGDYTNLYHINWNIDQGGNANFNGDITRGDLVLGYNSTFDQYGLTNNNAGGAPLWIISDLSPMHLFSSVDITIDADASNLVLQPSNGSVGIGVSSPSQKLDVGGNTNISGVLTTLGFQSYTNNINWFGSADGLIGIGANVNPSGTFGSSSRFAAFQGFNASVSAYNPICFTAHYGAQFYLHTNGKIGIGNTNPTVKLDVTGDVNIDGNLTFDSFTESVVAIGNSSTSKTISLTSGTVQTCTLTGNCVFTMPTATAGKSFTLFLSTGSGSFTGTFTGVRWAGGTAPTITTTVSKVDILSFISDGSYWYGSYSQNYG